MSDGGAPKIYTRGGDKGKTSLIGGARVAKSDPRLEAYGTVDELNCVIGLLIVEIKADLRAAGVESSVETDTLRPLISVQSELFDIGSHLACEDANLRAKLPDLPESSVKVLENAMDAHSLDLKPLKNFVLPGGSRSSSVAHMARTVCRRAERAAVALDDTAPGIVIYLNRLSDYFFVLARHLNRRLNIEEPIWIPKSK
jgi:cob(I)alamin adenosyltransferase